MPIAHVRTLEDVYRFEPVPEQLTEAEAGHVLGAQANVWTEVMEDHARVDYQTFPGLAAFAEVAWSALPAPAERDFADFERRMAAHYPRLDALGSPTVRPPDPCRGSAAPESSDAPRTARPERLGTLENAWSTEGKKAPRVTDERQFARVPAMPYENGPSP